MTSRQTVCSLECPLRDYCAQAQTDVKNSLDALHVYSDKLYLQEVDLKLFPPDEAASNEPADPQFQRLPLRDRLAAERVLLTARQEKLQVKKAAVDAMQQARSSAMQDNCIGPMFRFRDSLAVWRAKRAVEKGRDRTPKRPEYHAQVELLTLLERQRDKNRKCGSTAVRLAYRKASAR